METKEQQRKHALACAWRPGATQHATPPKPGSGSRRGQRCGSLGQRWFARTNKWAEPHMQLRKPLELWEFEF